MARLESQGHCVFPGGQEKEIPPRPPGGFRLDPWQAAEAAGADILALCDTNGGSLPAEIARITGAARAKLKCRLGIHTHDDIGLGVANALAALEVGASHVQGTINGYGGRTGNCNLI